MSDFTTEQLEALKEGAPVMHRHSVDFRGERSHSVKSDSGMVRAHTGYGPDGGAAYKDAELFAAAPALADEAIRDKRALIAEKQENQRIRTELEQLLDTVKRETWLHDDEGRFPETVQLGSYVTSQLTRILEADND